MPNSFVYQVISIDSLSHSVAQIFLKPLIQPALSYRAGQYVHVLHASGESSPLSIACASNAADTLEFHLFHAPYNQKANDLLRIAVQEKKWQLIGPEGFCTVDKIRVDKPIIFLARGTGFAPIKAVIEGLLLAPIHAPITFYWSVKTENDLYLIHLVEKWVADIPHFTFIPVFTQETGSHVLPRLILQDHPSLSSYQVYASGPQPLITTAFSDFVRAGLNPHFFYSDLPTS